MTRRAPKSGLQAVYRTLAPLPGANPLKDAHAALDAAVLAAYGFSAKKDLLAQLLALNLEVAQRIDLSRRRVGGRQAADTHQPGNSGYCRRAHQ